MDVITATMCSDFCRVQQPKIGLTPKIDPKNYSTDKSGESSCHVSWSVSCVLLSEGKGGSNWITQEEWTFQAY